MLWEYSAFWGESLTSCKRRGVLHRGVLGRCVRALGCGARVGPCFYTCRERVLHSVHFHSRLSTTVHVDKVHRTPHVQTLYYYYYYFRSRSSKPVNQRKRSFHLVEKLGGGGNVRGAHGFFRSSLSTAMSSPGDLWGPKFSLLATFLTVFEITAF